MVTWKGLFLLTGTDSKEVKLSPDKNTNQFCGWYNIIVVFQLFSHIQLLATRWTACSTPSRLPFTFFWSLLKLMSIELMKPYNHLILCHLLMPSVFPRIRGFSNELALHIRWPEYWSFSFSISPSNEYSVLIFFRIDWLDLFVVQGTLKSLLQHHRSKASILQRSAFFMVWLSRPHMTTEKTIVWLYERLLGKWCLCFLVCYLGLS